MPSTPTSHSSAVPAMPVAVQVQMHVQMAAGWGWRAACVLGPCVLGPCVLGSLSDAVEWRRSLESTNVIPCEVERRL